jgi:uncharacterized protein YrrD
MMRTLENILGYRLATRDGEIGTVFDFFLDDSLWRLRYLVVETGSWLRRRRVLIAPVALGAIDGVKREFTVSLTRDQVESSPDVDTEQPVSRQEELSMNAHYGWPAAWAPEAAAVAAPFVALASDKPQDEGDPHLRSFREIVSYRLEHDGEDIAKVQDFVIEDRDWSIKFMVAMTGGWLDSRQVVLPADSVREVSWSRRVLAVSLSKEALSKLPPFDSGEPVNNDERIVYFDYHGKAHDDLLR